MKYPKVLPWIVLFTCTGLAGSYGRVVLGVAVLVGIPWCIALAWQNEKRRSKFKLPTNAHPL